MIDRLTSLLEDGGNGSDTSRSVAHVLRNLPREIRGELGATLDGDRSTGSQLDTLGRFSSLGTPY